MYWKKKHLICFNEESELLLQIFSRHLLQRKEYVDFTK